MMDVANHPIGRTQEYFHLSGIFKDKDPAMFKVPVDDAMYSDVFTLSLYTRYQPADATNEQLYFDTGIRCII